MADILGSEDDSTPIPLSIVIGAAEREMRTALFLAINSVKIRLVATASTAAELITHTRSLQPDAVVIADDILAADDLVTTISAIQETMSASVLVVGPSASAIAEAADVAFVAESSDLLDSLLVRDSQKQPPVAGVA